jgi:hypothetical protein
MATEARPPNDQANAGFWLVSLAAAVVNVGFWHAAADWGGGENYYFLAWLLFGLPLLFLQVFVVTPWLVARIRGGIGAGNPGMEVKVAVALPAVTVGLMIAILFVYD